MHVQSAVRFREMPRRSAPRSGRSERLQRDYLERTFATGIVHSIQVRRDNIDFEKWPNFRSFSLWKMYIFVKLETEKKNWRFNGSRCYCEIPLTRSKVFWSEEMSRMLGNERSAQSGSRQGTRVRDAELVPPPFTNTECPVCRKIWTFQDRSSILIITSLQIVWEPSNWNEVQVRIVEMQRELIVFHSRAQHFKTVLVNDDGTVFFAIEKQNLQEKLKRSHES